MTEVSYIVQNGQKVYFKDTAGRELLTQKQVKLKAGRGISIAEDGTISATGGSGSANGFFINASGELNNLTFDKTPAELNTAIENGDIVIVSANNAKFVLTDVKDGTYLFSYLVVLGEEDCLAQMATISATSDGSNWTEIKTNLVSIKTLPADENPSTEDIYHEDDDFGVDFNIWNKESYSSQVYNKADNIIFRPKYNSGGSSYENEYAYYVDENYERVNPGKCTYSGGNFSNQEEALKIKGVYFNNYGYSKCYIDDQFIEENAKGEKEMYAIHFDDKFNVLIKDQELRNSLPFYQDNLILGEGLEIDENGVISIKEQA